MIAQGSEFPLRKPPSFHYDFFILGITTFIAGLLGLPAPNGLIPQAPIHTQSLLVTKRVPRTETKTKSDPKKDDDERDARVQDARAPAEKEMGGEKRREAEMEKHDERVAAHGVEHSSHGDGRAAEGAPSTNRRKLASRLRDYNTNGGVSGSSSSSPDPHSHLTDLEDSVSYVEQPISVVEQRVSNLAQGSLCLVVMAGPLLHHVVGLIPRGVLAGLFWYMGAQALESNGITSKLFYLLRDRHHTPRHPRDEPLRKCRKSAVLAFAAIELLGFAATFAITNTIAAIGFPVIILLLVPLRTWVMPRLPFFTKEELAVLDAPTGEHGPRSFLLFIDWAQL